MGRVVQGRRIGRSIGVPTANIRLQRCRAAVAGVFAVQVDGIGPTRCGAANIGVRPTVESDDAVPLLEVHILDFAGDVYGRLLTVTLRHKIRDERPFDSMDAMKAEILRDIDSTRRYFAGAATAP